MIGAEYQRKVDVEASFADLEFFYSSGGIEGPQTQ